MRRIKIGLSMLYRLGEPFNKMVQSLSTVETPYIEVVDDGFHTLSKTRVAMLNEVAKSSSVEYTVHAPFADINIASPSKSMLNASIKRLHQSMAYANALNAQLWIFHPGVKTGISMFYPGADWKQNIEGTLQLHKTAEEYGLSIALENLPEKYGFFMKQPEDFQKFYKETGLNGIGIALDVGHANLKGQLESFLRKLPDKIVHMHISDNMGEDDQHLGVGYGKINWQRFAETLREIAYDKTVMVESMEHVEESLQKLKQLLA
ncbi:MAG: sugar phosphate isomerase/epimerase [Candidatus Bathyarchaeota archaeon]|nr:MAG: sugar phosphate isomerase/epimerase [Candidatus Bathyarchaeota archaeon]